MRVLGGVAVLLVIAVACKTSTPDTATETTVVPVSTSSAIPADAAIATVAPDATAMVTLYERGTFVTVPAATASAIDGCIGTASDLAACTQLKPTMRCDLAPWLRASDVYCRGAAMGPGDMKPRAAEPCGCTCSDAYIKAADEWSKRTRECANVP